MIARGAAIVADPGDDGEAAITALMLMYAEETTRFDKALMREVFAAAMTASADFAAQLMEFDMRLVEQVAQLVVALQAAGAVVSDVDVLEVAMLLYGILGAQLLMWVSAEAFTGEMLSAHLRGQIKLAFRGLRPQPNTALPNTAQPNTAQPNAAPKPNTSAAAAMETSDA